MKIELRSEQGVNVAKLVGRLDGFGANEAEKLLPPVLPGSALVFDCSELSYLSSAGVRFLLTAHHAAAAGDAVVALSAVQPYCVSVLEMSGLAGIIPIYASPGEAVHELQLRGADGTSAEKCETETGVFIFHPVSSTAGTIDILGEVGNVIDCAITEELVVGKPFFETEYSLGVGALGAKPEDYLPLMGESIMVAGAMVWLPTDGNNTPDYMIPRKASTTVVMQTGFNASIRGGFNEFVEFTAAPGRPASVRDIYRALFDLAKTRRLEYRGVLGLAMRAEIDEAFGAGIMKSPLLSNRPANGKMITDPSNYDAWFESDKTPRNEGTTALICGRSHRRLVANRSGTAAADVLYQSREQSLAKRGAAQPRGFFPQRAGARRDARHGCGNAPCGGRRGICRHASSPRPDHDRQRADRRELRPGSEGGCRKGLRGET